MGHVFYILAATKRYHKVDKSLIAYAKSVMPSLFRKIAVGLDLYMVFVYLKQTTDVAAVDLQRLRTKTKRRARMDPLHLRACILEMNRIAGSSTTVAHCHSGNPKADQLITDAMCGTLFKIQIKSG